MADGTQPDLDLSEFGITGPLRVGRGARGKGAVQVLGTRSLDESDFAAAATKPHASNPSIRNLRQSHHQLAKLLAQGTRDQDVALITGYSISRISVIKTDPQFEQLYSYYKQMEEEGWKQVQADMRERLKSLGFDSIEVLHSRLEEEPESFSVEQLIKLVESTSDRTGHGKTSTLRAEHTHALDDATLARIRAGSSAADPERKLGSEDRGSLIRLVRSSTGVYTEASQPDGIEGGGTSLREEGPEGA